MGVIKDLETLWPQQAPRAWFDKLKATLTHFGFFDSKCNPSPIVYNKKAILVYLLVYVDDVIITRSDAQFLKLMVTQLQSAFSLKDLGTLNYFLGNDVKPQQDGFLLLTQSKYLRDLVAKTNMQEVEPVPSPMLSSTKLSKKGSDVLSNPTMYRSVIGALQYATITRPDISFAMNKVCQYMSKPLESHR